ncbi:MAG: hypothetical protein KAS66_07655, partial [Candidatus Omnitrophica bacterium]|nr:hypothetical protein [Candidatus Omnitrophota bacterium]
RGNFEEQNPETGVADKHRIAALKGKGNSVSNAEIAPAINFEKSMYIGYTGEDGYVRFMEIEMRITNRRGKNQVSMSGTEGEIMKTDVLEKRVEEHWENVDMEDEYGHMADSVIGEEPSDEDVYGKMPIDAPDKDEDEDAYNEAYNEAYDEAMEDLKEKRKDYLDGLERDLKDENHPFEVHQEERIDGEFYTMTSEAGGQVLDRAVDYTPIIPAEDLEFMVSSWKKHHLFGSFGVEEKAGRSAPTLETMQELMKIYYKYEARGGDNAHIEKIVDATGV